MTTKSVLNKFTQQVLSLYQQRPNDENSNEIQRLIAATKEAQILQAVDWTATQNEDRLVPLVKGICIGLSGESPAGRFKRKKLIRTLIELLRGARLHDHVASGILCIVFSEVDLLNATDILDLLRDYKRAFERGIEGNVGPKYIDGFTKLLHALDNENCLDGETPGRQLREKFLKGFCQPLRRDSKNGAASDDEGCGAKWHPTSVLHILMAFKDAMLNAEQLSWTASKTIGLFPKLDLDELPSVIYELLALAKGTERILALSGICDFFSTNDKIQHEDQTTTDAASSANEWECLKRCEGFVLLHIMHAIRMNHETGRMLLTVLKGKSQDLLLPFNFGLLLAATQIGNRMKEQCLDLAKATILQHLKTAEKREKSRWIQSRLRFKVNFEKLIKEVAETSQVELGWEYSLIGLRELGFMLLETHLPKLIILGSGKLTVESSCAMGYNACILGKSMIYRCFVAFNLEMRQAVIKRVFDLITIPSSNGRNSALFFIEVLSGLVCRGISAFLASDEQLLDLFELLPTLLFEVGVPLLKALLPVIKLKPTLRDALVTALKKALFSRTTEARKTAVGGFLLFLKHFKVLNAFQSTQHDNNQSLYYHSFPTFGSQVLSDVRSDPQRASYERLCLEVIGCLRRTLVQQGELKEILYHGLCSVVRRNESTLQPVLDFLYRHFQNYLVEPDTMPPFKLKDCIQQTAKDTVITMEAFGRLIYAMTQILKQAKDDKERFEAVAAGDGGTTENSQLYFNYSTITLVRDVIGNLAGRVSDAELEDFGIDKSADFSPSVAGEKNLKMASLLSSTYEVLVGFMLTFYDFETESSEIVLKLHAAYLDLKGLLQEKTTAKGKKAAAAAGLLTATLSRVKTFGNAEKTESIDVSTLDLSCLLETCSHLLRDQSPRRREGLARLRRNDELICWIFQMILAKVNNLSSRQKADTSRTFETICKISALMHQYYADGANIVVEMKRPKLKHLKLVALDIVSVVLDVVNQQFVDKMEDALQIWSSALDPRSQALAEEFSANLAAYGRTFQRHLRDLLVKRAEVAAAPRRTAAQHGDDSDDDTPGEAASRNLLITLIKIIDALWKHLPVESEQFRAAYGFTLQLCQDQTIGDVAVAKAMWQTLLRMHRRMDGSGNLAQALSENIHFRFGDLDPGDETIAEPEVVYASVSLKTAASVTRVLLQNLDDWRDDCAFLVDYVRHSATLAKNTKGSVWSPDEDLDSALCDHLRALANVWLQLVKSVLPNIHIQTTTRSLRSSFDAFTGFMRYYTLLHQSKLGSLTSKFVEFANFVGSDLMSGVYRFISYNKCTAAEVTGTGKGKKRDVMVVRQAMREGKDVPGLIFAVETFKKCLIELSGKTKNKQLIARMYLGHNRDFKIDYDKLERAFAKARNGDAAAQEVADDDDDAVMFEDVHRVDQESETAGTSQVNGNAARASRKRKATDAKVGKAQRGKKSAD